MSSETRKWCIQEAKYCATMVRILTRRTIIKIFLKTEERGNNETEIVVGMVVQENSDSRTLGLPIRHTELRAESYGKNFSNGS
jgi:hypothetical protein